MLSYIEMFVRMHAHAFVFTHIMQAAVSVDVPLVLGNPESGGLCRETNLLILLQIEIGLSLPVLLHIYSPNLAHFFYLLLLCNTDLFWPKMSTLTFLRSLLLNSKVPKIASNSHIPA